MDMKLQFINTKVQSGLYLQSTGNSRELTNHYPKTGPRMRMYAFVIYT